MHITQWGEFGILFAAFLARAADDGRTPVGAATIAAAQGVSVDYAQQVLQRLRRGMIVESVRGPQGGYRLTRPAREITLLDVLVAAEGDTFQIVCDFKPIDPERCAPAQPCGLRAFWRDLKDHMDRFLGSRSLQDLVDVGLSTSEQIVRIGK